MSLKKIYVVCASQRVGSSFLCACLRATNVAGRLTGELLHGNARLNDEKWLREMEKKSGLKWPSVEMLHFFLNRIATGNGIAGAKVFWAHLCKFIDQFRQLDQYRGSDTKHILEKLFPSVQYIFLTRRDKIAQAVSYSIASRTNMWVSTEKEQKSVELAFDFKDIDTRYHKLLEDEKLWKDFFLTNQYEPLELIYEDYINNPDETVRMVMDFLDVEFERELDLSGVGLKKQSNHINEKWILEYKKMKALEVKKGFLN